MSLPNPVRPKPLPSIAEAVREAINARENADSARAEFYLHLADTLIAWGHGPNDYAHEFSQIAGALDDLARAVRER